MKIKEQTSKLAAGCSKHCFEVVDKTDEVSYIYLRQGEADVVWIWFSKSISTRKLRPICLSFFMILSFLDSAGLSLG